MAQKYAKDQPAGFTNLIEKVAIVGVSTASFFISISQQLIIIIIRRQVM